MKKEYYANLTDEEKAEINRGWAEVEHEKYNKEHTIKCPSCGGVATNLAPNGAGIAEECNWHCNKCGWKENKELIPFEENDIPF